jgi:hypothetical protein
LGGNAGLSDVVREVSAQSDPTSGTQSTTTSNINTLRETMRASASANATKPPPVGNAIAKFIDAKSDDAKKVFREGGGFGIAYSFGSAVNDDVGDSAFG